jgi:hypothetical protein
MRFGGFLKPQLLHCVFVLTLLRNLTLHLWPFPREATTWAATGTWARDVSQHRKGWCSLPLCDLSCLLVRGVSGVAVQGLRLVRLGTRAAPVGSSLTQCKLPITSPFPPLEIGRQGNHRRLLRFSHHTQVIVTATGIRWIREKSPEQTDWIRPLASQAN